MVIYHDTIDFDVFSDKIAYITRRGTRDGKDSMVFVILSSSTFSLLHKLPSDMHFYLGALWLRNQAPGSHGRVNDLHRRIGRKRRKVAQNAEDNHVIRQIYLIMNDECCFRFSL